jgi:hypothetical protein
MNRPFVQLIGDIIAFNLIVLTLVSVLWFFTIFANPYTLWNPFPPPSPTPLATLAPTPVATPVPFATSAAQGNLILPTQANLSAGIGTPLGTVLLPTLMDTPTILPPTITPKPLAYAPQGEAIYSPNFGNGKGCEWQGVAGVVLDGVGNPVDGLSVLLERNGTMVTQSQSGSVLTYAPRGGGYELKVSDQPIASQNEYAIRLYKDGEPVSEPIFIATYEGCERNLMLLNFQQR